MGEANGQAGEATPVAEAMAARLSRVDGALAALPAPARAVAAKYRRCVELAGRAGAGWRPDATLLEPEFPPPGLPGLHPVCVGGAVAPADAEEAEWVCGGVVAKERP